MTFEDKRECLIHWDHPRLVLICNALDTWLSLSKMSKASKLSHKTLYYWIKNKNKPVLEHVVRAMERGYQRAIATKELFEGYREAEYYGVMERWTDTKIRAVVGLVESEAIFMNPHHVKHLKALLEQIDAPIIPVVSLPEADKSTVEDNLAYLKTLDYGERRKLCGGLFDRLKYGGRGEPIWVNHVDLDYWVQGRRMETMLPLHKPTLARMVREHKEQVEKGKGK